MFARMAVRSGRDQAKYRERTCGNRPRSAAIGLVSVISQVEQDFPFRQGTNTGRGGSSSTGVIIGKLATEFVELPIWETFEGRVQNVLAAKREVLFIKRLFASKRLPTAKPWIADAFSECSASMRQVWMRRSITAALTISSPIRPMAHSLATSTFPFSGITGSGFPVSVQAAENEAIVGGERGHTEEHYKARLTASIRTALRLLRPDRWMSIVFQHWDVSYFEAILETAARGGGELKAAITQTGDVIWSMHKKKNSASVLAGELILTFYKAKKSPKGGTPEKRSRRAPEAELSKVFDECLGVGTKSFTSESLFR